MITSERRRILAVRAAHVSVSSVSKAGHSGSPKSFVHSGPAGRRSRSETLTLL
jgi:hypothetical protein